MTTDDLKAALRALARYEINAFTEGYEDDRYAVLGEEVSKTGDWVKWSDIEGLLK